MATLDPYDDVPYKSLPIEWTAPERLAVAALLHGGPRTPLHTYRVLELGCGNGANLLPQAYYRRHAAFVGVDAARSQIERAESIRSALNLSHVEFIHADFLEADARLAGQFDYIIGHGIFSWVPHPTRDALLRLCAKRLRPGGLLYLNYNAYPGWAVRGMVREFLLAQTAGTSELGLRATAAQAVSSRIVASVPAHEHAYAGLITNEFKFVCDNDVSYVAHEYLAEDNHAYWRSEFMALAAAHGFEFVADADFNYPTGRIPEGIASRLIEHCIVGRTVDDTVDLLCYRQLHSPILTNRPFHRRLPDADEFGALFVASCLQPCIATTSGSHAMFHHPSGYEVEVKEDSIRVALDELGRIWPRGVRLGAIFHDVSRVMDDLHLLHRNGLIELRGVEMSDCPSEAAELRKFEIANGGYVTTAYHTREAAVA
jgi:SAM-dependent methyltransferase